MAIARMGCGSCGAPLVPDAAVCARCGEPIEMDSIAKGGKPENSKVSASTCTVCGHRNTHAGSYCESCGSLIPSSQPHSPDSGNQVARSSGVTPGLAAFEPWQLGVGALVVILLGVFVYLEVQRPHPEATGHVHTSQQPEASHLTGEIDQLQKVVDGNPADDASLLRLANILHDAGMSEPRYLTRAIDTYKKYLSLKPDDANARVDLGICYFEIGRMDSMHARMLFRNAVQEMELVISKTPAHQPAAFNLGIVHLFSGNAEESTRWFQKAAAINPESDLGRRASKLIDQHPFPSSSN